jgi:hypothetical protein
MFNTGGLLTLDIAGCRLYDHWQEVTAMPRAKVSLQTTTEPRTIDDATRLDAEMQQYAGKWVAIVSFKVIAFGDNLKTVMAQAQAQGYKDPLVMRAPLQGVWVLAARSMRSAAV